MSQIIKNEDGTETEVFTAEELEEQKQATLEAFKAENPDKTTEIEALEAKVAEKEEEIAKLSEKDINFTKFRTQQEAEVKKIKEEIETKVSLAKKEVLEGVMKDHYNETLAALAEGDKEVEKKIEHHYKRLGDTPTTKNEITNKMKDAWLLATKQPEVGALNSMVISSGGVGRLGYKGPTQPFSAEEQVLAAKFGLSAEDIKKYGK